MRHLVRVLGPVCSPAVLLILCASSLWSQTQVRLTADETSESTLAGKAIAYDGETVAVGAFHEAGDIGIAYLYSLDRQPQRSAGRRRLPDANPVVRLSGAGPGSQFGRSLDLDGRVLVVGAPGDGGSGAVYVYQQQASGAWAMTLRLAPGPGEAGFGHAVGLSGSSIVVSALDPTAGEPGRVFVYERGRGDDWNRTAELTPEANASRTIFGAAISIDGDRIIVGAPGAPGTQSDGAAFSFARLESGQWVAEGAMRIAGAGRLFGSSVASSGDAVVIAAAGRAFVFDAGQDVFGSWILAAALQPADPAGSSSEQAPAVSISGDRAVLGLPSPGAVYVFHRDPAAAGAWTQQARMVSPAPTDLSGYGSAVSLNGGALAVSADADATANKDAGLSYVALLTETIVKVDVDLGAGNDVNVTRKNGVIDVGVFTTAANEDGFMAFDAASIVHESVVFNDLDAVRETHSLNEKSMSAHLSDLDEDGDDDRTFHFDVADSNVRCSASEISVSGQYDLDDDGPGVELGDFRGFAAIAPSGCKKSADLDVIKSLTSSFKAGETATYNISVTNLGPDEAQDVEISDVLDSWLTFNAVASSPECAASGAVVACDLPDLALNATASVTIAVDIAPAAAGSISNTATIEASNDPSTPRDSNTVTTPVVVETDLEITKTPASSDVVAGAAVTYTLTAKNKGPADASSVQVVDAFPAALSNPAASGCTLTGTGPVIWTIGNLGVDATASCDITFDIAPEASVSVSNSATVSGGETDPVSSNDSASTNNAVVKNADLSITKSDGLTEAVAGTDVTYTITATHSAGPSSVIGATISDVFPTSLSNLELISCTPAAGGVCDPALSPGALASNNFSATVDLPVGSSVAYVIRGRLSSAASGSLANTASIAAPNDVVDENAANDDATDSDTILQQGDLTISKSDDTGGSIRTGGAILYTIVASNNGPSDAVSAVVADNFPAGLDAISITCLADAGSSCTSPGSVGDGPFNFSQSVTIAAGESVTFSAVATVDFAQAGALSNTATVAAPAGFVETAPGDESDAATASVTINLTPTAAAGTAAVNEDSSNNLITLLGGDADSDDLTFSLPSATTSQGGSLTSLTNSANTGVSDSATVLYTPPANFDSVTAGIDDSFTFDVADGFGGTNSATVTITVSAVIDDAPTAIDDGASTDEDTAVVISVLSNDLDPDIPAAGDVLTVSQVNGGTALLASGASVSTDGTTVTYDPNGAFEALGAGQSDTDSFTYTIQDLAGLMSTATVNVTINGVDDPVTAITIVEVSGTTDAGQFVDPDEAAAASFTLSAAYEDVDISANILCIDCYGILYLATDVGPSASTADVVASVNPFDIATTTPYFSDLTLEAGTYFLVLGIEDNPDPESSTGRAVWSATATTATTAATIVTDAGVTKNTDLTADPAAALAFQSDFDLVVDEDLHFTVTGSPVVE